MNLQQQYYHWFWGENNIRDDKPNYLANMELGVCIRFDSQLAMFASYEDFYESIADVQFITGTRPSDEEVESILTEAWNFLAIEERILDGDIDNMDDDLLT